MLTQFGNSRAARVYRVLQRAVSPLEVRGLLTHDAILNRLAELYQSDDFKALRRYQREWARGYATAALNAFWADVQTGYLVNGEFIACGAEKSSALLRALSKESLCAIWKTTGKYYIEPRNYNFTFIEPAA